MTTLDIILLVCFIPAIWQGISKGLIRQLAGFAGLFLSIWAAKSFFLSLGEVLARNIDGLNGKVAGIISFLLIFFVSLLIFGIIGNLLTKIVKFASLGWINRLLGVVFGIFKAALILALTVSLFEELNARLELVKPETLASSAVYDYLKDFGERFFPFVENLIIHPNA